MGGTQGGGCYQSLEEGATREELDCGEEVVLQELGWEELQPLPVVLLQAERGAEIHPGLPSPTCASHWPNLSGSQLTSDPGTCHL